MILNRPLQTVTPSVDGDVLVVLARATASFTAPQIQTIAGRHSVPGIRLALTRLVAQGVVHAERTSTSVLYSLNREHLAADPIIALSRMRATLLDRLAHRLSIWSPLPAYAALFGSGARGDMRADSDLDVLLVRPDGVDADGDAWTEQLGNLLADVTSWTGNDLRVLEFDENSVLHRGRREPVLESVLAEGLTLYGPEDWLRTRLGRGTVRGPHTPMHS